MLSYLEQGQFKLKEEIAVKLVNKLNFLLKNHNQTIDIKYVLETPKEQIEKILIYELKNIKKFNFESLNEFRETFIKFGFYFEYIKLFFILGKYLKTENVNKAELLYEEILEISIDNNIHTFLFNIILELQRIYSLQENFNKSLILYKKVNKYLNNAPQILGGYINYNFGLAFETKKYSIEAINLYKKALIQLENHKSVFYVKNNLSICYINIAEYEKSKKIILELLEKKLSNIEKSKCYSNLLMNAVYTKDLVCIKITIPKLEALINLLMQSNIIKYQSYYCLGRAYMLLEDRYNALINFEKESELGIGENKIHFFIDQYEYCIEQLAKIYNDTEKLKFKKLEKYILDIPKEMFNKDFFIKISVYFLRAYTYKEFYIFYEKVNRKLYEENNINFNV